MTEFFLATAVIVGAIVVSMVAALARGRDSLHPALVLGPMMLFLYVGMPLYLRSTDGFFGFLTEAQLGFAQLVNMAGVLAVVLGIAAGSRGGTFRQGLPPAIPGDERLATAAIRLGVLGVFGFAWGLLEVGGLRAAYGQRYGGGWSDSGYVRELYHLTIPAILMLLASGQVKRSFTARLWLALFAMPLLMHGILGARRGPLFVILVTVLAGRYLIRNERPRALLVLAGSATLGVLLLFLVSNRDRIYIGSDLDLDASPTEYIAAGSGNEYIFGAGAIVAIDATGRFAWGGRYATVLFVRPIPRSVWPTKYQDAADWFGTSIEVNLGIDPDLLALVLGWRGAIGAAPGIVADMWVEFWWGMVIALFLLGFGYGRAWKAMVDGGGLGTLVYGALLCLSVYLVMQTLEAMLFRFLFMVAPAWFAWRWAARPSRVLAPRPT